MTTINFAIKLAKERKREYDEFAKVDTDHDGNISSKIDLFNDFDM